MRLLRIGAPGQERPVVADGDATFDLRPVTADIDPAFFESSGIERTREALRAGSLPVTDIAGLRIGAPIARPSAIVCIGQNYAAHAAESGSPPPTAPIVFYKSPNTLVGPNDDVLIPRGATKVDWEAELAVVIGRRVRYLESPADALAHVAGYAISNDVSERRLQIEVSGGQWSKGKSCETFNPFGPWILTADEVPDPQTLQLRSHVNGDARQDSNTADMIFSVATLLYELSQFTVLEPGDIVNTGTPQGVALSGRFPYLAAGDAMDIAIDRLGAQRQHLVQA